MAPDDSPSGLTETQAAVAATFFDLEESQGFVLVGGGALLAHGLIARPTTDLDFFTSAPGAVVRASRAFERACEERRWTTRRVRQVESFWRIIVEAGETTLQVDIARDGELMISPVLSAAGPTPAIAELAAMKLLALFARAEPRDFCDVAELLERIDAAEVVGMAQRMDPGCTSEALAAMMRTIGRLTDRDLTLGPHAPAALRVLFEDWANRLEEGRDPSASTTDDG